MKFCLACLWLTLYRYRILPRRIARTLFSRSASLSDCYKQCSPTASVKIADKTYQLLLPMRFKQNWTLLFEEFTYNLNSADAFALEVFRYYSSTSSYIFDIGMNAGLYLYNAVAVCPQGSHVYGFEPNYELASLVDSNLRLNGVNDNVEIMNVCVGSIKGEANLYMTNTDHMHSLSLDFIRSKNRPVLEQRLVSVISIDDFVQERGIEANLMKIDVEGLETDVLKGAWQTIEKNRPTLFIEITDLNLQSSFIERLYDIGYRCHYLRHRHLVDMHAPDYLRHNRASGYENYIFAMH